MAEKKRKDETIDGGWAQSGSGAVDVNDAVRLYEEGYPQYANDAQSGQGQGVPQPSDPYMDEIQRYESDKNYKALFNANVAAYNMKLNSQKYLGNAFAQQGFGTQGYSSSARVGIENQYQNMYAQNLQNYDANQMQIDSEAMQRSEAAKTESDNQLATFLQSAGSEEAISRYMKGYGYSKNKDGVWVDANGNPASAYIQTMAQYASDNNVGDKEAIYQRYSSFIKQDSESEAVPADEVLSAINDSNGLMEVALGDALAKDIKSGSLKNGAVYKLPNGTYVVAINGILYPSTRESWLKADDRR